jgi:hypothetical protein
VTGTICTYAKEVILTCLKEMFPNALGEDDTEHKEYLVPRSRIRRIICVTCFTALF